jgi:hypothetical protein
VTASSGEIDYLCSMLVATDVGTLHLWATPEHLVLDRLLPKPSYGKAPDPPFERVRMIPLEQVVSIEIDAISGDSSSYGWKPTTGFMHGPTKSPAVTGVLAVLADGEHVLWRVPGKAPIEVKAELGKLIARVGS